jgi:diguanylate cyclase (GGDEF)-like protein
MQRADWGIALGAALLALLMWAGRHELPLLERIDRLTLDLQTQARGPLAPGREQPLALIAIDDRSLQSLGGVAPHRAQYATLLQQLERAGAKAVALDVLMVQAQPQHDALLAERLSAGRSGGLVVGLPFALPGQATPGALTGQPPLALLDHAASRVLASPELIAAMPVHPKGLVAPLPLFAEAAPLMGHVTAERGIDGALRYDLPLLPWQGEWFPSLALRLAGFALGEDWAKAEVQLGTAVRWGKLHLPLDQSSRQWINYYGPAGTIPTHSFIDVIEGRLPAGALKGALVVVGATALGSGDTFPTPFDSGLPGMERLATVTDNIITGRVLQRGSPIPEIAAMLLLPFAAVLLMLRLPARQAAMALLLLLLAGLLLVQMRFQWQYTFYSLAFPLIALGLAVLGGALLRSHRERLRKEAAVQALRVSEERYALAARGASDGLWGWDQRGGEVYFSERWWALMGLEPQPALGMAAFELPLDAAGKAAFQAALHDHLEGRSQQLHHTLQFRQGEQDRALLVRGMASRDEGGQLQRVAGSLTDLSETLKLQRQLVHDALHDRLTGLANRALFIEHLQQLINEPLGVVLIGIDGFRQLNETQGTTVGDALLREVGRRLSVRAGASTVLRPTVARLGPDLFGLAFVAPLEPSGQDAAHTPELLLTLVRDPLLVAGREMRISATAGWAHRSQGLASSNELLVAAEMALALAKDPQRGQRGQVRAYDPADQLLENSRRWLKENIDIGLRDGQFEMYYQPLIRLADRQLLGFEALIRWHHPERGFIMPGDFIPFAEESGQIVAMGRWTLMAVADQLTRWHEQGFEGEIAVNLSSRQFVEGDLHADARAALARLGEGISPKRIKLEVTESMAMANPHETAAMLQGLHAMGFKISIDDFGTGYSSLAYLHQFPFDTLKIDRSFVMRLHQGRDAQEIVRTIVGLTQALGKQALAEGVEEERQAQLLHELGVQIGQGWLFGKALPVAQAQAMFQREVEIDLS